MAEDLPVAVDTLCFIMAALIEDLEAGRPTDRKDLARRLRQVSDTPPAASDKRRAGLLRHMANYLDPPPRWTPTVIDGDL